MDGRPTVLVDGITFHPESVGKMETPRPVVIGCGLAMSLWLAGDFPRIKSWGIFWILWTDGCDGDYTLEGQDSECLLEIISRCLVPSESCDLALDPAAGKRAKESGTLYGVCSI